MTFDPEKVVGPQHEALPAELNELTRRIIGAAIEAHRNLAPGLRENMYERALIRELTLAGLRVERQVPFHVHYKGEDLGVQIIDLVVDGMVIIECKSVDLITERDHAQLVGYLRFTGLPVGLLINFNVARLKDGITRRINYPPASSTPAIAISRSFSASVPSARPL
jgi:GxxExxY protein